MEEMSNTANNARHAAHRTAPTPEECEVHNDGEAKAEKSYGTTVGQSIGLNYLGSRTVRVFRLLS